MAQGEGGLYAYGPSSFPSNAAGNDNYWVQPVFFSAFAAPVGLSAVAASDSEIDLSCANIVPDVTSIQVQRSVGGGSFSTIATLDPSQLGYPDRRGLSENTQYTYQLVLQLSTGAAVTSMPAVAYTLPAVDGLQATAVSDSEIDLSWESNAPDASGFVIQQLVNGVWTTVGSASTPSYPVTGLSPDQDYTFQVCAILPSGYSQFTGPADAYTLPAAPSALTATANGTNEIDLSWPQDDANVYGYELQRSDDGGQTFSTIAQLDPDSTSYTDTDVLDGTEYQYQLFADNGSGESDPSAIVSATTDMAVPTELTAAAPDGSGVQLAWVNNSQTATSFIVQRSTDGENFSNVTLDDNGIDTGIVSGTEYYYQVIAKNDTTQSAPSDMVTVTPLGSIVAVDDTPATGVSFQVAHGKSITLYASQLLGNDIDSNTSPQMSIKSFTNPSGGTLTDNQDGTYTYAASNSFTGTDSFTYTPTDQYNASSNAATVQIQVTDSMPEAYSGHIEVVTAQDPQTGDWQQYPGPVTGTMTAGDPDGDALTFSASLVSGPGKFTPGDPSTGAYTYTPSTTDGSPAVIVFTANDGALTSYKASLTFPGWKPNNTDPDDPDNDNDEVIAGLNLPYASNQDYSVDQGAMLQVPAAGLFAGARDNDSAPDSDTPSVDPTLIEPPQHGSATINDTDGSFTYTPDPSFSGRDYFTWRVDDGSKKGDYATAFIDVQPVTVSMKLTVGSGSDPAPPEPPQDTPFIPIDDGYDSDTQNLPNDQLPVPDTTDPELVPASLTMTANTYMWGTWSLSFPSSVRVFQVQRDGSLSEVTSGQQSAPIEVDSNPTLSFMVQGVGPQAASVLISATLTPASDPNTGNPPPNAQLTTKSVTANVGPSPLQVLSVKDNVAGAALTSAQQTKSGTIYLPISDAKDGFVYNLPVHMTGFTGTGGVDAAKLTVPFGWQVYNAGSGMPMAGGANIVILQPNVGYNLSVLAINNGGNARNLNGAVEIYLTSLKNGRPNGAMGNLGKAIVTPFFLSHTDGVLTNGAGPTDVPQYGAYAYNVTGVKGGQWNSATGGSLQIPDPSNPSNATIFWAGGPAVGNGVYQASPQYVWDLAVNVFQVAVSAPAGQKAAQAGTVEGTVGTNVLIASNGLVMRASVSVTGPNGTTGMQHLTVGFVQNLMPSKTQATYGPKTNSAFSPAIDAFVDGSRFWDTQDPAYRASLNNQRKFYSIDKDTQIGGQSLVASPTYTISTVDAPFANLPVSGLVGRGLLNMSSSTILWNLTMYVAAITDESPTLYVPEAYLPWVFNGTGNVAQGADGKLAWTGNGAGVTFPPDSNNPMWTAADQGTAPPLTTGHQFNSIFKNIRMA